MVLDWMVAKSCMLHNKEKISTNHDFVKEIYQGSTPAIPRNISNRNAFPIERLFWNPKDGKGFTTDYTQPKLPGLKEGGLIKGFPKIATKGWK